MAKGNIENGPHRRCWDPIVKLTHWGVVVAVIANALFTGKGSGWHIWVGYGLAALLALRMLWGLVGPLEARFTSFPPSPARAFRHVQEIWRGEKVNHSSHNPLGALMVYAIWSCLGVIVATGVAMSGPPPANPAIVAGHEEHVQGSVLGYGSEKGAEEGEGEEILEEVHETAVNLLYILIALHLLGVIFETRRTGRETILAMMPGGNRSRS